MQLKLIENLVQQYSEYLNSRSKNNLLYIWESQKLFQDNWELEAMDLAAMFDNSLQNSHTRRLWKKEEYAPKEMMLKFIKLQPDFVLNMFADLFNEAKEIGGRVDRFVFYCDELLKAYKETYPHSIENNHFHGDQYQMVSLYLTFRYPDVYAYYDHRAFVKLLQFLGTKNIPVSADFERFVKVSKTLFSFIQKKEGLLDAHQARLEEGKHFMDSSMLMVYEMSKLLK